MPTKPVIPRFAAVIFADDIRKLATFYTAVAGLTGTDAGKGHVADPEGNVFLLCASARVKPASAVTQGARP